MYKELSLDLEIVSRLENSEKMTGFKGKLRLLERKKRRSEGEKKVPQGIG